MNFGRDEEPMSTMDAIAGLRSLGGSLPDAIDASICRRAADVLGRLLGEVNAGVRVACALESILDSYEDDLGKLIVSQQAIAEANAALDERLGVVREPS